MGRPAADSYIMNSANDVDDVIHIYIPSEGHSSSSRNNTAAHIAGFALQELKNLCTASFALMLHLTAATATCSP